MAPHQLEKIESGPGNGMGSEASNPQHLVHGPAADSAPLRLEPRERQVALGILIACNQLKLHEIPRKSLRETTCDLGKGQSCRKRRLML